MLLSNTAIFEALDDGRLSITPEPTPRHSHDSQLKTPYDSTAINLSLGNVFSVPIKNLSITLDVIGGDIIKTIDCLYEEQEIPNGSFFELSPNKFVLAQTSELVALAGKRKDHWHGKPLLAARIEGKSSFARCGLFVHFTAPTIHCGFSGTITLEMICLGQYPIKLTPGMPICQLLVEQVVDDPQDYLSQFQGQSRPAGLTGRN